MKRAWRGARGYPAAEDLATSFAQRRGGRWAVVEDFRRGGFVIMPEAEAFAYMEDEDAEVQYVAGPPPAADDVDARRGPYSKRGDAQ